MEEETMDLQKLNFFTEGNTFTGSRTKDKGAGRVLRYLARPEEDKLLVWSWAEDVCFEAARERKEKEFPLDEEGVEAAKAWLFACYQAV